MYTPGDCEFSAGEWVGQSDEEDTDGGGRNSKNCANATTGRSFRVALSGKGWQRARVWARREKRRNGRGGDYGLRWLDVSPG